MTMGKRERKGGLLGGGTAPGEFPILDVYKRQGGAIGLGVQLGQLFRHRRGKAHVGQRQHGAGGTAQPAAQLLFGQGEGCLLYTSRCV